MCFSASLNVFPWPCSMCRGLQWYVFEMDVDEGDIIDLPRGGEDKHISPPLKKKIQPQKGGWKRKEGVVSVRVCLHLELEGVVRLVSEPTYD